MSHPEQYAGELALLKADQASGLFNYTAADKQLDSLQRNDPRARLGGLGSKESEDQRKELAACGANTQCAAAVAVKYDRIVSDRIEFNLGLENAIKLAQQCAGASCQNDAIKQLEQFKSDLATKFSACKDDGCRLAVQKDITPFRAQLSQLKVLAGYQSLFSAFVELGALGFTENAQNGGAVPGKPGVEPPKRANGRGVTNEFPIEKVPEVPASRKFESPDPIVGKTATDLDAALPGAVKDVNVSISNEKIGKNSDADIMLKNGNVIEVKSGTGKGTTTQVKNQGEIIGDGKEVMVYGPDLKPSVVKGLEKSGIKVFKTMNELVEYVKSKGM